MGDQPTPINIRRNLQNTSLQAAPVSMRPNGDIEDHTYFAVFVDFNPKHGERFVRQCVSFVTFHCVLYSRGYRGSRRLVVVGLGVVVLYSHSNSMRVPVVAVAVVGLIRHMRFYI